MQSGDQKGTTLESHGGNTEHTVQDSEEGGGRGGGAGCVCVRRVVGGNEKVRMVGEAHTRKRSFRHSKLCFPISKVEKGAN